MSETAIQNIKTQRETLNQQWLKKITEYTNLRSQPSVDEEQALKVLHEIADIQTHLSAISIALNIGKTLNANQISDEEETTLGR